jgi:hypothetical protein
MSGVGEAAREKMAWGTWTVMTDCLSRGGETPFPLRGWGAMIEEYNIKKNKGVIGVIGRVASSTAGL